MVREADLFDPADIPTLRQNILDKTLGAVTERFPLENGLVRMDLVRPRYEAFKPYTTSQQKDSILRNGSTGVRLKGTVRLIDSVSGEVLDQRNMTVARVPYLSPRGTYIHRGNEYTMSSQLRLRPGVYTRKRESGEVEAHFNIMPGEGRAFRIFMEPKTGVFRMQVGSSQRPMYHLMRGLGFKDTDMYNMWGRDIFEANRGAAKESDLGAIAKKLGTTPQEIAETIKTYKVDPFVTGRTIGEPHTNVTTKLITQAMNKILAVSRGTAVSDSRDSAAYQSFYTPDDFFSERVRKDAGHEQKKYLSKVTRARTLKSLPAGFLTRQINSALFKSGLGNPLEEINPLEMLDQRFRVLRLGEGGIPSAESVPDEARAVQPSYLGVIDPVRGPESTSIGVDLRLAYGARKGPGGELYGQVKNTKTGRLEHVPVSVLSTTNVALPGEMESDGKFAISIDGDGNMTYVPKGNVDYAIPSAKRLFDFHSGLVPMISAEKGGRLFKSSKMFNQALPLVGAEAPLVQPLDEETGKSPYTKAGEYAGAVRATAPGTVTAITKDYIEVKGKDGVKNRYDVYTNFPYNRATYIHNEPSVQVGDPVPAGGLLATSNFTDKNGDLAVGRNLNVAMLPYMGNYEDAVVMSESGAKKMSSTHMYKTGVEHSDERVVNRNAYISRFPSRFSKEQLATIGDDGVVKAGTIVRNGDPVILSLKERAAGPIHKAYKKRFVDGTDVWEHTNPGIITDVVKTNKETTVLIKADAPMEEADKIVGRYGNKGVAAVILPDDKMLKDSNGNPFDLVINPGTVTTRGNPAQLYEMLLGKVAQHDGEPVLVPSFVNGDYAEMVAEELKKRNLSPSEVVYDPEMNKYIPGVLTGPMYILKLHHTAESKSSSRERGRYTQIGTPARGGDDGAKKLGLQAMMSLVSHGALDVIRDAKTVRGASNEDYWRAFTLGMPLPAPKVPIVFDKFVASLMASGINVDKRGNDFHLLALRDKDIDKLSRGEITKGDTVRAKDLEPVVGGLFDPDITGGHYNSDRWAHITLPEKLPNPVMEEPIRRMLGFTKSQLVDMLAGKRTLYGKTGGSGMYEALQRIDPKKELVKLKNEYANFSGASRDNALKLIGYYGTMVKNGLRPEEMMMTKYPVLPTSYRPILIMDDRIMVDSPNSLYNDLVEARNAYNDLKTEVGEDVAREDLPNVYAAMKAVSGLGDPVGTRFEDVKLTGLLGEIWGGSPKIGLFQNKLLGTAVDLVGRAAITPNPDLDMDHVGLPEEVAWKLYRPFIFRKLKQRGASPVDIVQLIDGRKPAAEKALLEEMSSRPIIVNRAPDLHKFNLMASFPVLTKGKTLQLSPVVTPGFNADFDGDAMNYHVPVTEEARKEAIEKMLPSSNLLSARTFDLMYKPRNEYALGLYLGTRDPSKKAAKVYATKEDAIRAYKNGEIEADDPIIIR